MRSAQDYDLFLRLAQRYEILYIPFVSIIYHIHKGNRISTTYRNKVLGEERIISKYSSALEQIPRVWACHYRTLAVYYRQIGEYKKALKIWLATVHKRPREVGENIIYLLIVILSLDSCALRWHHRMKTIILQKQNITIEESNTRKDMENAGIVE